MSWLFAAQIIYVSDQKRKKNKKMQREGERERRDLKISACKVRQECRETKLSPSLRADCMHQMIKMKSSKKDMHSPAPSSRQLTNSFFQQISRLHSVVSMLLSLRTENKYRYPH